MVVYVLSQRGKTPSLIIFNILHFTSYSFNMIKLQPTPKLDKEKLVELIKEKFLNIEDYKYHRVLQDYRDNEGNFIGDNFWESTFKLSEGESPTIYEITGPYDIVSKKYAYVARVFKDGDMVYQFDMRAGNAQRVAAIVWGYLSELNLNSAERGKPKRVLLIGPGNINRHVLEYLVHFMPELENVDYYHYKEAKPEFEKFAQELGVGAKFVSEIDYTAYDTFISAVNGKEPVVDVENFKKIKPGSVFVSLSTTGANDLHPEIYGLDTVNLFFDYEGTKTFTEDMRTANEKGYLENVIYYTDVLRKQIAPMPMAGRKSAPAVDEKVNVLRLTGTPMQNIAVIEMMLAKDLKTQK